MGALTSAYTQVPIRLWAPTLLFAVFIVGALFAPDLVGQIGASARQRELLGNGIHIGMWLSGAYLIVRMLNQLLWEGFVAHVIERPVPRLLKDSLAIVVFLLAVAGIVGLEFGQPVIGIWATSGAIGIILGIALRSIILDIFTGLAVNFDHSYRIGDWVELVERAPPIRGKVVTRIILDFSVHTARALRIISAGARASCGPGGPLHHPEPNVVVWGSSELGIEYRVRHWQRVNTLGEAPVRDVVLQSVLRHLVMAGLSPAYPKLDTFRAKMPIRQLEHHSIDDRAKLLRQLEIFDTLDDAQLERLGAETQPQHFTSGDTLTTQGAPRSSMFVIAEGLCEVSRLEDGAPRKIATIEPGDVVGERSMLTGEPHSTTVTALTEVVAYAVLPEHLAPILADHPELYEQISHSVALSHLRFEQSLAPGDDPHHPHEVHGIAAQIVDRMREFFHTLGRERAALVDTEAHVRHPN